jgi:hypothetical protein
VYFHPPWGSSNLPEYDSQTLQSGSEDGITSTLPYELEMLVSEMIRLRMAWGGHGLPKVSTGSSMPDTSTPCGQATPETASWGGRPAGVCLPAVCLLSVYCLSTVCLLSVYCLSTVCLLSVYCLSTVCLRPAVHPFGNPLPCACARLILELSSRDSTRTDISTNFRLRFKSGLFRRSKFFWSASNQETTIWTGRPKPRSSSSPTISVV